MKRRGLFVGLGIFSMFLTGTIFASNEITIRYNGGNETVPPLNAKIENGQLLVPIRWITQELGSSLEWNEKEKIVEIQTSDVRLQKAQINQFLNGLQAETPKQAVEFWIQGVKARSGSVQYATLSPSLQEETRDQFEEAYWVTGGSSPWINKVVFTKEEKASDSKVAISIQYDLVSSNWSWDQGQKEFFVEKNPDTFTWSITDITTKYNEYEMFTPAETVVR